MLRRLLWLLPVLVLVLGAALWGWPLLTLWSSSAARRQEPDSAKLYALAPRAMSEPQWAGETDFGPRYLLRTGALDPWMEAQGLHLKEQFGSAFVYEDAVGERAEAVCSQLSRAFQVCNVRRTSAPTRN